MLVDFTVTTREGLERQWWFDNQKYIRRPKRTLSSVDYDDRTLQDFKSFVLRAYCE